MRVAMVGPFGFHPNKTMRSRALPLAKALSPDHQVKIFMPPWQTPDEGAREWKEGEVEIQYTRLGGGAPSDAWRLLRAVLAWNPDTVHAFKPKAYSGLVSWWLWQFHKRRIRLVVDSDDWEGRGGWNDSTPYPAYQKQFFAWQEEWGLSHNHSVTVASKALESLVWARGVLPDRVFYLPNGSGIEGLKAEGGPQKEEFGLAQRPVLLLYSRLFEFKIERLTAILSRIQAAIPDLAVLLVGTSLFDQDSNSLRMQLDAAGLTEAVVDLGWVEEKELPGVLSAADVGLYLMDDSLLNRTKCPVKLADMLSMGIPAAAEDVGQVSEYVRHGQTGLLYKSGEVEALSDGVVALLNDKDRLSELSASAAAHYEENFSWRHLAKTALKAYGLSEERIYLSEN